MTLWQRWDQQASRAQQRRIMGWIVRFGSWTVARHQRLIDRIVNH